MENPKPFFAIIGGSGFYTFPELRVIEKVHLPTKYGEPSERITIGEYAGQTVAFLPRHGETHHWPPHRIPYKANLSALKELGVTHIVGTCTAGSLKKKIPPRSFLVPGQFIDRTWGRDDAFEIDQNVIHLPCGEPYSAYMRGVIIEALKTLKYDHRADGTVVVIQGPRFNTKAESEFYCKNGWDIVNMTQYPECYFAAELKMHYAGLAAITDYDVCINTSDIKMSIAAAEKIRQNFMENTERTRQVLLQVISNLDRIMQQSPVIPPHIEEYFRDQPPAS